MIAFTICVSLSLLSLILLRKGLLGYGVAGLSLLFMGLILLLFSTEPILLFFMDILNQDDPASAFFVLVIGLLIIILFGLQVQVTLITKRLNKVVRKLASNELR